VREGKKNVGVSRGLDESNIRDRLAFGISSFKCLCYRTFIFMCVSKCEEVLFDFTRL